MEKQQQQQQQQQQQKYISIPTLYREAEQLNLIFHNHTYTLDESQKEITQVSLEYSRIGPLFPQQEYQSEDEFQSQVETFNILLIKKLLKNGFKDQDIYYQRVIYEELAHQEVSCCYKWWYEDFCQVRFLFEFDLEDDKFGKEFNGKFESNGRMAYNEQLKAYEVKSPFQKKKFSKEVIMKIQ